MKLRYSPTSPYVRKVRVTAIERSVTTLELVPTDTWSLPSELVAENPLGKVPSLMTDDGMVLYDSPVICEYIDAMAPDTGSRLFPSEQPARWRVLRLQALGDGMMDAAVERYVELTRPVDRQMEDWIQRQRRSLERALDTLDASVHELDGAVHIGTIAVACALGYLDLRFTVDDWRAGRPGLARWFDGIARRHSMVATAPPRG